MSIGCKDQVPSLSNGDIPFEKTIMNRVDELFIQLEVQSSWICWAGTLKKSKFHHFILIKNFCLFGAAHYGFSLLFIVLSIIYPLLFTSLTLFAILLRDCSWGKGKGWASFTVRTALLTSSDAGVKRLFWADVLISETTLETAAVPTVGPWMWGWCPSTNSSPRCWTVAGHERF